MEERRISHLTGRTCQGDHPAAGFCWQCRTSPEWKASLPFPSELRAGVAALFEACDEVEAAPLLDGQPPVIETWKVRALLCNAGGES